MPKIVKEFPKAKLHILGDGPQRINLMKLTEDLKVFHSVYFHGFVPNMEVQSFYKACRLVCLPTLHESFGLVLVEAMASGRPTVTTNAVGPREIVVDGETGFIVPMADSDALAEAIIRLLSDYELSYKMGAEGRKVAEEKYDWNKISKQFYNIYKWLVS
jgi:glycosyltransferase involved in cell wall biosynthesis